MFFGKIIVLNQKRYTFYVNKFNVFVIVKGVNINSTVQSKK
jgi:hypothetical protein